MKNTIKVFALGLGVVVALSTQSFATEAEQKKTLNLNAESIARATKIINENRELFENPELLEKYLRVARALNKNKEAPAP